MKLSNLKKGNYIVYQEEPFIVEELNFESFNPVSGLKANILLRGIFSDKVVEKAVSMNEEFKEAELSRRCGTIISKQEEKVEVIDLISFETIKVDINKQLLEEADENDQVTYLKCGNSTRVVEVRKEGNKL